MDVYGLHVFGCQYLNIVVVGHYFWGCPVGIRGRGPDLGAPTEDAMNGSD